MSRPDATRVPVDGIAARLRPARLRKHADFEKVYRNGRRLFSAHMTVFFLLRDRGPARVGFTVPRAMGTAVERNRMRRRLREAVRLNLGAAAGAVDVVIHPKKSALTAEFAALGEEIARAFAKIQSSAPSLRAGQANNDLLPSAKNGDSVGSK